MNRKELLAQWLVKVMEDKELLASPPHAEDGMVYALQFIHAFVNDYIAIRES